MKFYVQNLKKRLTYLDSSHKNTRFQKNNRLKRNLGSEYTIDLKINYFRVFFQVMIEIWKNRYLLIECIVFCQTYTNRWRVTSAFPE